MPKKFMKSFRFAQAGLKHALQTQRNVWIHLAIGVLVMAAAVWFSVSPVELAILTLTISFVLVTEMINTAIEEAVNLAKPEAHPLAALAKNLAAAAVLAAAVGSIIVGLFIFIPRMV